MAEMKKYNKLIRDRVPEVLERKGIECSMRVADNNEYKEKLLEKLREEVNELIEDKNEEELADVLEVIDALFEGFGFSRQNVERLKEEKFLERGGFKKRLILEETRE